MPKIKVGTFNSENLFMRYRLLDKERGARNGKPVDFDKFEAGGHINMIGWSIDDFGPISKSLRKLTAKVITENDPDVLAVQEVENLEALIQFNRKYLKNKYQYMIVIDGNDPRQIDVGLLSKFPLGDIRTHRFEPAGSAPNARTFSRDCLEVEIVVSKTKTLTMLVNHFKSKIGGGEEKRKLQATRVADILKERFGSSLDGNFIVAGDLNCNFDAPEIQPLLGLKKLENVIQKRLAKEEQWTHYYNKDHSAEQLDYILLSPSLSASNPDAEPYIERRGLGKDIKFYNGPRFNDKLTGKEGASDHCAVFISLNV